jgi:hypothetical protein
MTIDCLLYIFFLSFLNFYVGVNGQHTFLDLFTVHVTAILGRAKIILPVLTTFSHL